MDVPDVLDSLIILVILACCIGPSRKIAGANDLIEVLHHLVGEFGGKEGDSSPIIERVPCFISQGFKFGNESIDFPWCESVTPQRGVQVRRVQSRFEADKV